MLEFFKINSEFEEMTKDKYNNLSPNEKFAFKMYLNYKELFHDLNGTLIEKFKMKNILAKLELN